MLDHYLGAPASDWFAGFTQVQRAQAPRADCGGAAAAADARDGRPGRRCRWRATPARYRDAWYGDIVIANEGGKLVIRFAHTPALVGDLEHWQYDTFVARWRDRELRADAYVTFALNPDGRSIRRRWRRVPGRPTSASTSRTCS